MSSDVTSVLQPFEIDKYIENLECLPIEEMFSPRWVKQSCRLVQLSVEVALETSQGRDEYVQRSITLNNKGLVVVWQLLLSETWRRNVLPLVYEHDHAPVTSLPFMLVLQTETALMTILESLVFHEESAESLDALVLDVIDYCVRQMTFLASYAQCHEEPLYPPHDVGVKEGGILSSSNKTHNVKDSENDICNEVSNEERRVQMVLSCRSAAVIQYLTECRARLPLCALTSLLRTHDVPQVLATLLDLSPWMIIHGDEQYQFQDGQWIPLKDIKNSGPISRLEGQIWVTLYSLLLDRETFAMYELSSGRRSALLKLRGKLNEEVLSHLPVLEPLGKWLAALAVTTPQQAHPPPLVTTVRQLGDGAVRQWQGKWQELFDFLEPNCISPSQEALSGLAVGMSTAWNLEALETLLPDTPVCATCGSPAGRRCSRCKMQWYCRRECQVKHWNTHQPLCDIITASPSQDKSNIIE